MGDVVSSATRDQKELRSQLKKLIQRANTRLAEKILSPYTITLGDEFQGISRSLLSAIETIFFLEEEILRRGYTFKLHYVVHWGEIETSINRAIAYEMMGSGLTAARAKLTEKRKRRPRVTFDYGDEKIDKVLNAQFFVIERIIDRWNLRDYPLILDLVTIESDSEVGLRTGKDRSLIWRRRETLRTDEYVRLKESLFEVGSFFGKTIRN